MYTPPPKISGVVPIALYVPETPVVKIELSEVFGLLLNALFSDSILSPIYKDEEIYKSNNSGKSGNSCGNAGKTILRGLTGLCFGINPHKIPKVNEVTMR